MNYGAPDGSWGEDGEMRDWERGEGDDRYDTVDGPAVFAAE